VRFQGPLDTCNAHAAVAVLECLERRAGAHLAPASPLFLFKVAKNLAQQTGPGGVYIRQVMGALRLVGVPPEVYWPYPVLTARSKATDNPALHREPPAFVYAVAADYRAVREYRLDPPRLAGAAVAPVRRAMRAHLAAGFALTLGFPLYRSALVQAARTGAIPLPPAREAAVGGHAVAVVGYDDRRPITNTATGHTTSGAFLIQNSWGTAWGDGGFGWLPYAYLDGGACGDVWTLAHAAWVATGRFQVAG
jgi:C1A family cysteine protease